MNSTLSNSTTGIAPNLVTPTDIINLAVHGLCGLLGIVSNSVTIAIILKGKRFGHGIKLQLLNLTLVDFGCSLLCPTSGFIGKMLTINYPKNNILCIAHQLLTAAFFCNSLYCTVSMSMERFIAVFFPLKLHSYSRRGTIIVILIGWILAFVLHCDIIIYSRVYNMTESDNIQICIVQRRDHFDIWKAVNIVRYILPVALLLLSYVSISIKLVGRKTIGERHLYSNQRHHCRVSLSY